MFQYAKEEIEGQLEEKDDSLSKIKEELADLKDELKEGQELVDNNNKLPHSMKRKKKMIVLMTIVSLLLAVGMLIGSPINIKTIFLAAAGWAMCELAFAGELVYQFHKLKKEYQGISQEEVKRFESEKEQKQELVKALKKDYQKVNKEILDLESMRDWIAETENMNLANYQTDSFFQADTKEEYEYLEKQKEYYNQLLDEFLEEKVNYSEVHLEDQEHKIGKVSKKILIKKQ